jgi:hypothetical protein
MLANVILEHHQTQLLQYRSAEPARLGGGTSDQLLLHVVCRALACGLATLLSTHRARLASPKLRRQRIQQGLHAFPQIVQ